MDLKLLSSSGSIVLAPAIFMAGVEELSKNNHAIGLGLISLSVVFALVREYIKPEGKCV